MCLAVYGRESLDELEAMVIPRFSEIVNKNVVSPRWVNHPFLPEHFATKVYIVPVKDSRTLTLTFPTGDLDQFYKAGVSFSTAHYSNTIFRFVLIATLFLCSRKHI